jgi:hypothetical protein
MTIQCFRSARELREWLGCSAIYSAEDPKLASLDSHKCGDVELPNWQVRRLVKVDYNRTCEVLVSHRTPTAASVETRRAILMNYFEVFFHLAPLLFASVGCVNGCKVILSQKEPQMASHERQFAPRDLTRSRSDHVLALEYLPLCCLRHAGGQAMDTAGMFFSYELTEHSA